MEPERNFMAHRPEHYHAVAEYTFEDTAHQRQTGQNDVVSEPQSLKHHSLAWGESYPFPSSTSVPQPWPPSHFETTPCQIGRTESYLANTLLGDHLDGSINTQPQHLPVPSYTLPEHVQSQWQQPPGYPQHTGELYQLANANSLPQPIQQGQFDGSFDNAGHFANFDRTFPYSEHNDILDPDLVSHVLNRSSDSLPFTYGTTGSHDGITQTTTQIHDHRSIDDVHDGLVPFSKLDASSGSYHNFQSCFQQPVGYSIPHRPLLASAYQVFGADNIRGHEVFEYIDNALSVPNCFYNMQATFDRPGSNNRNTIPNAYDFSTPLASYPVANSATLPKSLVTPKDNHDPVQENAYLPPATSEPSWVAQSRASDPVDPTALSQLHISSIQTGRKRAWTDTDDEHQCGPTPDLINMDKVVVYVDPVIEDLRERAERKSQKKTRIMKGPKAPKSCWYCRHISQRCVPSGDGVCRRCKEFCLRIHYDCALPKWACNIETKFADLDIFLSNNDDDAPDNLITATSYMKESHLDMIEAFFEVVDIAEPEDPRRNLLLSEDRFYRDLAVISYMQSIIRRRRALLTLRPDLKREFTDLETIHRQACRWVLYMIDSCFETTTTNMSSRKITVFNMSTMLSWSYECFRSLSFLHGVDSGAIAHLLSALENRLKIAFDMLLPSRITTKRPSRETTTAVRVLSIFQSIRKFIPLGYEHHYLTFQRWTPLTSDFDYKPPPPQYPAGIPQVDLGYALVSPCVCAWAIQQLPITGLSSLGFQADLFQRFMHSEYAIKGAIGEFAQMYRASFATDYDVDCISTCYRYAVGMLLREYLECLEVASTAYPPELLNLRWFNSESDHKKIAVSIPVNAMILCCGVIVQISTTQEEQRSSSNMGEYMENFAKLRGSITEWKDSCNSNLRAIMEERQMILSQEKAGEVQSAQTGDGSTSTRLEGPEPGDLTQ